MAYVNNASPALGTISNKPDIMSGFFMAADLAIRRGSSYTGESEILPGLIAFMSVLAGLPDFRLSIARNRSFMVASTRHTPAVQQIIQVLASIPAGRVASYGQVADLAGLPGRARLVGKVLREAADESNLPWHRIVQASGRIAFKAGSRQAKKQTIRLTEEGVVVSANRVSIKDFGWQPSLADMLFQFTG